MKKFSMAGTLGDAFIVYCKLYDYWRRTGEHSGLYRYSEHIDFDKPINEFFRNIPFVEYLMPCIYRKEEITKNERLKGPYLNTVWNGKALGNEPDDPKYIKMEPYPEVFIKPEKFLDKNKFHIGIQLRCGREGKESNMRGFSLKWIRDLRNILPLEKYSIHLLGTVGEREDKKIKKFCQKNDIENFVNQISFSQWLARILGLNFFITFEGFSAYFSMSQKIRSLVFFIVPTVLSRIPPQWRKENIIWQIKHPLKYRLLRKSPHYSPNTYSIDVDWTKKIIEEYAKRNWQRNT